MGFNILVHSYLFWMYGQIEVFRKQLFISQIRRIHDLTWFLHQRRVPPQTHSLTHLVNSATPSKQLDLIAPVSKWGFSACSPMETEMALLGNSSPSSLRRKDPNFSSEQKIDVSQGLVGLLI